jgi:O-antigen/teichoic acid export membrane protein
MGNATNSVARGLLHVCDCFKYDFFFNIGKSWVSLACFAAVYLAQGGIIAILAVESALAAIFGVILILLMLRVLHGRDIYIKLARSRWWQVSRELWRYQILGYLRATVMGSHRNIGMLLLGYLTSPTEVGSFHAAKKITDPLRNSTMIFYQSLYPRYGRLWFSRESRELKSLFKKSTFLFVGIGIGLLILLWPLMGMIIRTLYGENFASSIPAAMLLLVSASLLVITAPLTAFLPAIGRNAPHLMTAGVMVITQIGFLFILAPRYGATGAAWAFLLAILAGNFVLMPQTLLTLRNGLKDWWYDQTPRVKTTEI